MSIELESIRQLIPISLPIMSPVSSGKLLGRQDICHNFLPPQCCISMNIGNDRGFDLVTEVLLNKFKPSHHLVDHHVKRNILYKSISTVFKGLMGSDSGSSMYPKKGRWLMKPSFSLGRK